MKISRWFLIVIAYFAFSTGQILLAQAVVQTNSVTSTTNTVSIPATWHTIKVTPRPELPKIHFYNKFNPIWWLGNSDEPKPPAWYIPDHKLRTLKWHFRNPLHNFDNYVIGVADKTFVRSGHYPERNANPHGGWDFEVIRYKIIYLPYLSYERRDFKFYFGWRNRGSFGIKLAKQETKKPK